ncbi:MAG: hypothetical protein ACYTGN_00930 [Planctomycetota bacterium]
MSIGKGSEASRRLVHLAFGGLAFLVPLIGRYPSIGLAAAALAYNTVLAPALGLDSPYRRAGEGRFRGLFTYPLAVLLMLCVAPLDVAAGAWVVMAVADPMAAFVGRACPWPRVPFNKAKSLAGTAAGFIAAAVACAGFLAYAGVERPLLPAVGAAAAGALAEAIPWPIDDNLPLAVAAATALWLGGVG